MSHPHAPWPGSHRHPLLLIAVAVIASGACLSAVVLLFETAGETPWFAADQARRVAHCDSARAASDRHACIRAVADRAGAARVAAR
jgi:hypothetical protein